MSGTCIFYGVTMLAQKNGSAWLAGLHRAYCMADKRVKKFLESNVIQDDLFRFYLHYSFCVFKL
jgi:hypothetical protein